MRTMGIDLERLRGKKGKNIKSDMKIFLKRDQGEKKLEIERERERRERNWKYGDCSGRDIHQFL